MVPVDKTIGLDLNNQIVMTALEYGCDEKFDYGHVAFSCDTCSPARYPKVRSKQFPMGLPEEGLSVKDVHKLRASNKLMFKTTHLMTKLSVRTKPVTGEHLRNSPWWHCDPVAEWSRRFGAKLFIFDQCCYGSVWKKRTGILSTVDLHALEAKCCHDPGFHPTVSGWRKHSKDVCIPTKRCQSYGIGMCRAMMNAVRPHLETPSHP